MSTTSELPKWDSGLLLHSLPGRHVEARTCLDRVGGGIGRTAGDRHGTPLVGAVHDLMAQRLQQPLRNVRRVT